MVIGELIRKVISLIIFDKILVERISKIKTMDDCFDFEEKFLNHHSFELREIILSLLEDEEKKAKMDFNLKKEVNFTKNEIIVKTRIPS